jgi:hypothetical protein
MTRYVMQGGGEDIFVYEQAAVIFQFTSGCCDKRLSEFSDGWKVVQFSNNVVPWRSVAELRFVGLLILYR